MTHNSNPQRHIFLVDDDEEDRELFSEALSFVNQSIGLVEIPSAFKLIETLNNPAVPKPEIIFMDINMPKLDGLECLKTLMATTEFKNLRIVILSTFNQTEYVEYAFENGASNYFVKPRRFDDLKNLIARALEEKKSKRIPRNKKNFLVNYSA
jgi:CheY-like chemotaxis protein